MRGVIQPPPPFPVLATVVLRHYREAPLVPHGAIGTIVHVHDGGDAYDVEWCDADGRTIALLTMSRGDLLLVPP
jgi:hypothetical protein